MSCRKENEGLGDIYIYIWYSIYLFWCGGVLPPSANTLLFVQVPAVFVFAFVLELFPAAVKLDVDAIFIVLLPGPLRVC